MNEQIVNRRGIPYITGTASSDGTVATIALPDHAFRWLMVKGIMLLNLATDLSAATQTNTVVISVNSETKPLLGQDNAQATVADVTVPRVYEIFYDKSAGVLQLI